MNEELLNMQFDEETEKLAAVRTEAIKNCYNYGMDKLAAEAIAQFDAQEKIAAEDNEEENEEEEEENEEEEMDEESEKAAAELGAFIERGFFDGLRKEGSARHDDELHYVLPYVMEKAAAEAAAPYLEAAEAAAQEAMDKIAAGKASIMERAGKYLKGQNQKMKEGYNQVRKAVTGKSKSGKTSYNKDVRMDSAKSGVKTIAKGSVPYAAAAGGVGAAGYGAKKALED